MRVSYISERSTNWTPQTTDRLSTVTNTKIFLDESEDEDRLDINNDMYLVFIECLVTKIKRDLIVHRVSKDVLLDR